MEKETISSASSSQSAQASPLPTTVQLAQSNQSTPQTTPNAKAGSNSPKQTLEQSSRALEVNYRTNVTPLFTFIENCNWKEVSNQCKNNASHVRTWVYSTGTDDPNSWCVWRRLPLHEACRRQPPLFIIQDLLDQYPRACHEKTQFGELPLHLALGCGADADVINLLLVYNPWAVAVKDNGGRLPTEILKTGKDHDDGEDAKKRFQVIQTALRSLEETVQERNRDFSAKVEQIKQLNDRKISELNSKAAQSIKNREDAIAHLKKKLFTAKSQITELVRTMKECEQRIVDKNKAESNLMDRVFQLEQENASLRSENQDLKSKLRQMEAKCEAKQDKITTLGEIIHSLLDDIQQTSRHQDSILDSHAAMQKEAKIIMERQQNLNVEIFNRNEFVKSQVINVTKQLDGLLHTTQFSDALNSTASDERPDSPHSGNNVERPQSPPELSKEQQIAVASVAASVVEGKK